jgi:hypothetical protein
MTTKFRILSLLAASLVSTGAVAGEKTIISLKDLSTQELKSAGIEIPTTMEIHIKGRGAGGDEGWTYKSDQLFAYGWIINAATRNLVWKMDVDNTSREGDDRVCDSRITLAPGSYEVYVTAPTFGHHTTFKHLNINIDHREKPLFEKYKSDDGGFFSFFSRWWSDDIETEWGKRSPEWGVDLLVDDGKASSIGRFTPPRQFRNVVLRETGLGEQEMIRQGLMVLSPVSLRVYAIGEGIGDRGMVDYGWLVNADTRERIWELDLRRTTPAGGAEKNRLFSGTISLAKGEYVLYFVTDDSHSAEDWNASPPYDPLNYGVTLSAMNPEDAESVKLTPYEEDRNVFLSITRVGDDENLSKGFTLKRDARIRIYAFGERSNSRRQLADYAYIIEAKTRKKIWWMDVDNVQYAGGALKNVLVDEVITIPRGSYIVFYNTDDSHAYDEWNADPPFDPEHYGITLMGAGPHFDRSIVANYEEERDKNIIAQLVRVGNNANLLENFTLSRTTRVRIYAIGEGQNRKMYDYGWIEDTNTGSVVWEMTYSMTTFAGGHRKNRLVNTTILLEKGSYSLHYRSDDSHAFNQWNVSPPEDQDYWGITLYRDNEIEAPRVPLAPEDARLTPGRPGIPRPPVPPDR